MASEQEFESKLGSIEEAKAFIQGATTYRPSIAIVCGTGLGGLCDVVEAAKEISYEHIPHFPSSTVPGHAGKLVFGLLGGKEVVCMKGRVHAYEGHSMWKTTFYMRVFASMGVRKVVVTNASGGVRQDLKVGDVIVLQDHINLPGMASCNPLIGLNDQRFGVRFQEMTTAYDKQLQELALQVAKDIGMDYVSRGVYLYQLGPVFESPAEVRFCRSIGADVVGMSTVPEVLVARHCGISCLGLSLVTNKAVDNYILDEKPQHEEVLQVGEMRAKEMQKYVMEVVKRMVLS